MSILEYDQFNGNCIIAALTIKGGHGILTKLAKDNNYTKGHLSNIIHGTRGKREKRPAQIIADYLGLPVRGVDPSPEEPLSDSRELGA